MFFELPRELQIELLEFISPPKWRGSMVWLLEWAQNLLKSRDISCVLIKLHVASGTLNERCCPNLMGEWEVHPSLTVRKHDSDSYYYKLDMLFEHWPTRHMVEVEEAFLHDEDLETMYDLLGYCPRQVERLPKHYYVHPAFYKLSGSNNCLTEDFGDILDYKTSAVQRGPLHLIEEMGA